MMLRRFFTLLAIYSGLALVGEPARAVEADRVSLAQAAEERAASSSLALPRAGRVLRAMAPPGERRGIGRSAGADVPAVRLRVDRARE